MVTRSELGRQRFGRRPQFLAARKAFDECPANDPEQRVKTAEKLRVATAALNKATTEYVPFITGRRPNIRLID
jgi:hypothetical protein